ncbi:energy transducer TonB [Roseivirga pacifica]|uniref:energy transducer TonB n=1 Tax=Roseivirga pacifica TaxID=1267423 RepID=UPI0020958CB7|nr:energy transducer TonB [Roseivirga pacifica]MCO6358444.1 TonB family protein [Roseivirga pacifica]MCO6368999.1 TonB family protein [Roseivirga pacifica]MCO6372297.1 TonB family protein [Roseivirga pacifica]MCO6374175.1 TonB family protein [Roseivirga pacifica]MCO6381028.1 TonB family protein [Roseivirga pacifica]
MKKLIPLCSLLLFIGCSDEDLYVSPDGDMPQAVMIIEEETETPSSSDDIFMVVEEQPSFPGGMEEWNKFLLTNLQYPEQAKSKGVEGRVFLTFVVQKDGELKDLQLIRGIGGGCDEEALRVLMASPNWEPGKQRGREVATRMQAAITFKLDGSKASPSNPSRLIIEVPDQEIEIEK